MAKIYNSDVTKGLAKSAGIQQNVDKTPNELAEKIVPTFETNPRLLRICDIVRSSNASATLYTTPTDRDFYLVAAWAQAGFTALGQSETKITITINGATQVIVRNKVACLANVVANDTTPISLNFPVKLDRGTNITLSVGNWGSGGIIGYVDESSS